MDILNFILNDPWGQYILGGFAASGFISHAVAITPTKKDDKAAGVIRGLLNVLAGNYMQAKNR